MKRTGFTLIELLVVVSIIAILAAFLFPVFALVREKARASNCLSNQRQLGLAIMMYADSYDQCYPVYAHYPTHNVMWYDLVEPYAKGAGLFFCPSIPRSTGDASRPNPNGGYGVNYAHVITYGPEWGDGPQRIDYLSRASHTIMLADGQIDIGSSAGLGWPALYCPIHFPGGATWYAEYGLDKTWALADRHSSGANYVFADGHVGWMKRDRVIGWSREPGKELWGHFRQ
jgi:prepilin-type N-terminal cleavage/methylation domain-containing protein/prepilin-type processing-associated H-X9-DG protein